MNSNLALIIALSVVTLPAYSRSCQSNIGLTVLQSSSITEVCHIPDGNSVGHLAAFSSSVPYYQSAQLDYQLTSNDYWATWQDQSLDDPIVTGRVKQSFFGLGLWLPDALSDSEQEMSYSEWLSNHGLQFSVAFGDSDSDGPKMRMDYRWHNHYQGDVMLQLEWPF